MAGPEAGKRVWRQTVLFVVRRIKNNDMSSKGQDISNDLDVSRPSRFDGPKSHMRRYEQSLLSRQGRPRITTPAHVLSWPRRKDRGPNLI